MENNRWQLQEAKTKFSQLINNAIQYQPQIVTKHGNNAVVVLSFEDYEKLVEPKKDLVSFLRDSPLVGVDLDIARSRDMPRDIKL